MFKIKVLDRIIEVDNTYSYIYDYCRGWTVEGEEFSPSFRVKVTHAEISCYMSSCGYSTTPEVVERVLMCKKIGRQLPAAGMFLLHGAVVEFDGTGIIFSAKRGVGKTTHVNLWRKVFGDGVKIINGDKPFITKLGDGHYACGTPWRGKEGMGDASAVRVSKLCFIERSDTPYVKKISPAEAWRYMSEQTVYPEDEGLRDAFALMCADFLSDVDSYVVGVNMKPESAIEVKNKISAV